jgi:hypothetical protein
MQEIYNAEDRAHAEKAIAAFVKTYGNTKWPKATAKITDGAEELVAFYDFPAEHWVHLHTTNPVESTFSTVKLRTKVTRGAASPAAALTMVFKLVQSAQERWRAAAGSIHRSWQLLRGRWYGRPSRRAAANSLLLRHHSSRSRFLRHAFVRQVAERYRRDRRLTFGNGLPHWLDVRMLFFATCPGSSWTPHGTRTQESRSPDRLSDDSTNGSPEGSP